MRFALHIVPNAAMVPSPASSCNASFLPWETRAGAAPFHLMIYCIAVGSQCSPPRSPHPTDSRHPQEFCAKKGKIQDLVLKDRRTHKFECVDK